MKTKTFDVLYHIGTLNRADKQQAFRVSHEGHGLSVSECPDAWRAIARLGGGTLWRLQRPGNRFLDFHSLSEQEQSAIESWGLSEGWIAQKKVWVGEYYDDEADDIRLVYEDTEQAVLDELECWADMASASTKIETRMVPAATTRLSTYHGFEVEDVSVPDLLAVAYADIMLGLDGVFWDDRLDVAALSAPRAVILPERVAGWRAVRAEPSEWFHEPEES